MPLGDIRNVTILLLSHKRITRIRETQMPVELKTETIQVRVTPRQANAFREKAATEGRRVSEWLRELARREVATSGSGQRGTFAESAAA